MPGCVRACVGGWGGGCGAGSLEGLRQVERKARASGAGQLSGPRETRGCPTSIGWVGTVQTPQQSAELSNTVQLFPKPYLSTAPPALSMLVRPMGANSTPPASATGESVTTSLPPPPARRTSRESAAPSSRRSWHRGGEGRDGRLKHGFLGRSLAQLSQLQRGSRCGHTRYTCIRQPTHKPSALPKACSRSPEPSVPSHLGAVQVGRKELCRIRQHRGIAGAHAGGQHGRRRVMRVEAAQRALEGGALDVEARDDGGDGVNIPHLQGRQEGGGRNGGVRLATLVRSSTVRAAAVAARTTLASAANMPPPREC